jgi:glycosyltransferase involved in cell wall biosynthesis
MNITIALEQRFWRTPDGSYWSETVYPANYWSRYLAIFDGVNVLGRVYLTPTRRESWSRVDGQQVSVIALPAYVGPWEFAKNVTGVYRAIRQASLDRSAVLLRVPGMIGTMVSWCLTPGQPYGIEVLQDPYLFFSRQAVSHPLGFFFRWWFSVILRAQCRKAACSLYVTERALQENYPPLPPSRANGSPLLLPKSQFSVGASDVEMEDVAFISTEAEAIRTTWQPRNGASGGDRRFRVMYVGTMERLYKAPDILIKAFAQAVAAGLDADLHLVGDGRKRPHLEQLAQSLGVGDRVKFLGNLPAGDAVRQQLDAADLFVLPSWAEGMPRAMLEAMARGLPCIGSTVGGIPELLPPAALVAPGDVGGLAAKIGQFAREPELRRVMGKQNLETARRYHEKALQPKREAFYKRLREVTEVWQRSRT